jgi:hypothetical protein
METAVDPEPRRPGFGRFLRQQMIATGLAGLALGLLLTALMLYLGEVSGDLSFQLELSRSDALWFLILPPTLLVSLAIAASPLSFALLRLGDRRRRLRSADP